MARDVLDTSDCAWLLKCSEDRIRHKVNNREIPAYKRDGKLYFSKKEINEYLTENKIATAEEIKSQVAQYLYNH
jgi:hypothetical protein